MEDLHTQALVDSLEVHTRLEVVHSLAAEVDTLEVDTLERNQQGEAHSQMVEARILEEAAPLHG